MFGYAETDRPWFISDGSGIVVYPETPFHADFYLYAICLEGKASIQVNEALREVVPGDFFTAIPSTILQLKRHSKSFRARVLLFERSFLLKNILDTRQLEHLGFFNYDSLAHVQLDPGDTAQLFPLLNYLKQRAAGDGIFQQEIIQSLIIQILFETAEIYFRRHPQQPKMPASREEELFLKFMKLIPGTVHLQYPLEYYCRKLCISEKYLIQVCKDVSGKTPGFILSEALLNEAKLLLRDPGNNVSMVSLSLNYTSVAAFSKFFKKHTGMSPVHWLRMN